ncbi:MAG: (2Fe-2S)-binding protein [Actinomycetota bacterium]|nr:(2Fe-2S)-binding protein [Actinomycetota bacterium]
MTTAHSVAKIAGERHGYLADSLSRVDRRQERAEIRFGLPTSGADAWISCADFLATPEAIPRWREGLTEWLVDTYGESPDRTTAGYVMTWYLTIPGYVAGLLFHHERRVPSLRPEDLAFRMAEPRPHPDGTAVLSPEFACLPDDPAAGTPAATVVADERGLAALLRDRFIAHATRFVDVFTPQVRLGRHMLWAAATDVLDNALWLSGRYGGDEAAGALDAGLVLNARHSPLTSASTLRTVSDEAGRAQWTRRRESCCFHYLITTGQGTCGTCPRLCRKS